MYQDFLHDNYPTSYFARLPALAQCGRPMFNDKEERMNSRQQYFHPASSRKILSVIADNQFILTLIVFVAAVVFLGG